MGRSGNSSAEELNTTFSEENLVQRFRNTDILRKISIFYLDKEQSVIANHPRI
jgi:hypothetical protein